MFQATYTRSIKARAIVVFLTLFVSNCVHALKVLGGTSDTPATQTFNFNIFAHKESPYSFNFYVGALSDNTGKEFSVAYVTRESLQFVPIAPSKVFFNGTQNADNPLYNSAISYLDVMGTEGFNNLDDRLAVVKTSAPANLYVISNLLNLPVLQVAGITDIYDAQGAVTSGIVGIGATAGKGSSAIFAAVKPNSGNFGDPGSGIAAVGLNQDVVDKVKQAFLTQNNAQVGGAANPRAIALDTTTDVVTIGGNLASMTNAVDLAWNPFLRCIYIALQVTAGAGVSDGAIALVVGSADAAGKITFTQFAPDDVFQNTIGIAGTFGANSSQSLHKIRMMRTTTSLDYIIILGGNGAPNATKKTVYALPLVNTANAEGLIVNPAIQGTLASKNAMPQDLFIGSVVKGRAFTVPAATASDTYTTSLSTSNAPALVGGGQLAAGNIDDLFVSGDTVFAVVSTPANASQKPGIFYSQAFFANTGQIIGWTAWQRVAGTIEPVFGASFDATQANFNLMTGSDVSSINTVQRTLWGNGDAQELEPLNLLLGRSFPPAQAGIQSLFDLPLNAPGLAGISTFIAGGHSKVALIQSGLLNNDGAFVPTGGQSSATGFDGLQLFTDGALTEDANSRIIVFSGGELNNVGPVTAAETATVIASPLQGYLFVGGTNGLAVLCNPNGTGWNATTGLADKFSGLTAGMSFKTIGDYKYVRKIINDGLFLYVLTDSGLDRLEMGNVLAGLGASGGVVPSFPVTTVAQATQLPGVGNNGALLDVIVSGPFALLATDNGLFRVGNGNDISQAASADEVEWTPVAIPEQVGPPRQLIAVSSTGKSQDVARGPGGLIYVLNGYQTLAVVNRFSIATTDFVGIDDNTVLPFQDYRVYNILSYFIGFGSYANNFISDGAIDLNSRERNLTQPPYVKSGKSTLIGFIKLPLNIENASTIVRLLRSTASGSWMAAGDFGLRINE